MKAKIQTAVFQWTFLVDIVFLAKLSLTALTAFAMSGRVWLASYIKHSTSSRIRPVCLRPSSIGFALPAYITIHLKPCKNISNPAIFHYISELTRQLFDAGIARIQPRVFYCFRVPIDQSENASIHVTRLLYRGSSYSACSFPEERPVVSQCCKIACPCRYLISCSDKKITIL